MNKDDIMKILKCPYKPIVDLAIELVNLTAKEKEIIINVYLNGYSEEETAEILEISRNTVSNRKRKALDKMSKAWKNSDLIEMIKDY